MSIISCKNYSIKTTEMARVEHVTH